MVVLELVLGLIIGAAIAGFAAAFALAFLVWPIVKARRDIRERFPAPVPGTRLRTNKIPVSTITAQDVARAVPFFIDRCVAKGYDRRALERELYPEYFEFIRVPGDIRHIVDEYGRKIAGDRRGDVMRVVVIDGDEFQDTAGFHELGHMAHETKGIIDYKHRDDVMWHEIVGWCRKEFANGQ